MLLPTNFFDLLKFTNAKRTVGNQFMINQFHKQLTLDQPSIMDSLKMESLASIHFDDATTQQTILNPDALFPIRDKFDDPIIGQKGTNDEGEGSTQDSMALTLQTTPTKPSMKLPPNVCPNCHLLGHGLDKCAWEKIFAEIAGGQHDPNNYTIGRESKIYPWLSGKKVTSSKLPPKRPYPYQQDDADKKRKN